jgi:hypothetical protein
MAAPLGLTIFQVSRYVPAADGAAQLIENVCVPLGGTDPLTGTAVCPQKEVLVDETYCSL